MNCFMVMMYIDGHFEMRFVVVCFLKTFNCLEVRLSVSEFRGHTFSILSSCAGGSAIPDDQSRYRLYGKWFNI